MTLRFSMQKPFTDERKVEFATTGKVSEPVVEAILDFCKHEDGVQLEQGNGPRTGLERDVQRRLDKGQHRKGAVTSDE